MDILYSRVVYIALVAHFFKYCISFDLKDMSRNVSAWFEKVEDALTFEHSPHRHIPIHVLSHPLISIAYKHR
jgi:hypothetical protein